MSEATQTQPEGPFAATPREELERQIMCPTVPKTEREWWAADEIERLKAELLERDAVWLPEKDAEIERLRAALEAWNHAVRIDVLMEGPRYMGVSGEAGKRAWEMTRAALKENGDE